MNFHVFEANMVETARHILLLTVLFTDDTPPSDRVERFLEIFMNSSLRESTSQLVERFAERLERVVGAIFAGESDTYDIANDRITQVFDFSLLKFKEKDALMDVFRSWSGHISNNFDEKERRDRRLRKYYDDRFDHRKNVVDWDYHMRLDAAGAGVVHFKHFSSFRLSGIAYPVREATFPLCNKTLVGFTVGKTKEFKDRDLSDIGRSVESKGLWCDVLNGPYFCYGIQAEDCELLKVANRQHVHNAVEISEHNVAANLFEMRSGVAWKNKKEYPFGAIATDAMNAWAPEMDDRLASNSNANENEQREWSGCDGAVFESTWKSLKVTIVGPGDFEKAFVSKPKFNKSFDAVVVGAWAAQRITPGLGAVVKPSTGVLISEGSKYMVVADGKASVAFAEKTNELAAVAGFKPVPFATDEPVDDEDVPESGIRSDGSRRSKRCRVAGVVLGVDDVHRCYVKEDTAY